MNTLIRNVRDLETVNRRTLESLLGQRLEENEQVIIRVVSVGKEPDAATRRTALQRAKEIAEQADRHRESLGVPRDEVDRVIDEAIQTIRRTPS